MNEEDIKNVAAELGAAFKKSIEDCSGDRMNETLRLAAKGGTDFKFRKLESDNKLFQTLFNLQGFSKFTAVYCMLVDKQCRYVHLENGFDDLPELKKLRLIQCDEDLKSGVRCLLIQRGPGLDSVVTGVLIVDLTSLNLGVYVIVLADTFDGEYVFEFVETLRCEDHVKSYKIEG